ncbi:M48 family metallopeptidase [uncultured Sphingomonas sp.]|uniref:M48 family metallopeptidase n=1 Tax=uncultured Sphingomonas sp. TaxID=158754 RepID=UPI0035CBD8B9
MAESAELVARWGEMVLPFSVKRSDRRTLRIVVSPDGSVAAYAPDRATDDEIVTRVSRRGGWIKRELLRCERWRPRTPARQYVSGETHLFLGKQYRLVVTGEGAPNVRLDGDRIILAVRENSNYVHRRTLLRHWYGLQSHRIFPVRLDVAALPFLRMGVVKPRLIIRLMSQRWGSFTAKGNLVLNSELAQASPHLIDYVIAHELAHALHPDHGPNWQGLLTQTMPDWRKRKDDLEHQLL